MTTREQFTYLLGSLDNELQQLGQQVITAVAHALNALQREEVTMASWVVADDTQINEAHDVFENRIMTMIATQQPVATDLRHILALSDIADELERIGDYAKGIAKVTIRNTTQPPMALPAPLLQMAEITQAMLRNVMEVVKLRDGEAARLLSDADDQVDALHRETRAELLQIIRSNPELSERAVELLRVAHNLERMGDRVTNIAERIIFIISGETINLNP
jgi:phosphate transport system protein